MFKLNTKVIWRGNDNDTLYPIIKSGTITKLGRDTVWLDNKHKPEDQVFAAFLYPDTEECRNHIMKGIELTIKHRQENDAYLKEQFEFNNDLVRKGLK